MLALEGQQGALTNDQVNGTIRNEVRGQKQFCHIEWEAESRGVEWDRVNGREAPVVQVLNSWPSDCLHHPPFCVHQPHP